METTAPAKFPFDLDDGITLVLRRLPARCPECLGGIVDRCKWEGVTKGSWFVYTKCRNCAHVYNIKEA